MRRWTVLLYVGLLTTSCGGGQSRDDEGAPGSVVTRTVTVTTSTATVPSEASPGFQLEEYLRKTFGPGNPLGAASWYSEVKRIIWVFGKTTIRSTYTDFGLEPRAICTAAITSQIPEIETVEVTDLAGTVLAECGLGASSGQPPGDSPADGTVTDPAGIECPPEFLSPEGYCSNPPTDQ